MQRRFRIRFLALFSIFLLLINTALPAVAALHPLSILTHNTTTGVSDIDITISLDWDPAKVNQTVTPRGMTVAETEAAVRSYAASLYAMTNGLHRLRNVYIHKNSKSWANADIRYVGTVAGRSNANVASWQERNTAITMYVYETNTTPDGYPGPVLAHESGHYIYGLLDEYREEGGKTIQQLIQAGENYMPSAEDEGTQPSIMNQHHIYPNWFSTAGSYAGEAKKLKTAHYRVYGKSIWDTLTSDPKTDPVFAQTSFGRLGFEAFTGKQVKGDKDLKAAQIGELKGFDSALKIIWDSDNAPMLNLVLLDSNFPRVHWSTAQQGAGEIAANIPADNMLQILSGSTIGMQRSLITESSRKTLASQAQKVLQGSPVSIATALTTAIGEVKKYQSTLKNAQTSIIQLITTSNDPLPASLVREMRQNKVMLKVILYAEQKSATKSSSTVPRPAPRAVKASDTTIPDDEMIYLSQVSQLTGGSFVTVGSAAELENELSLAATESDGIDFSVLATSSASSLNAGEKLALRFKVGPLDQLPVIMMAGVDDNDFSKIVPSLTAPDGTVISAGNLPAGITLDKDEENISWDFTIDPSVYSGAPGTWTATMTATAAVAADTAILVATLSTLQIQMDVMQRPVLGNLLEVSLKLDRPVLQAKVWADVYDNNGKQVRSGLTLVDKGENGDRLPNDGVYTVSLNDLPTGEYSFQVYADDNNGTAIASDRGTFFSARKSAMPDEATGPFQRTDAGTFVVAAFTAPAGGDSGGCAVGNGSSRDLLLALTFIFPLLYLVWPLRRRLRAQR